MIVLWRTYTIATGRMVVFFSLIIPTVFMLNLWLETHVVAGHAPALLLILLPAKTQNQMSVF